MDFSATSVKSHLKDLTEHHDTEATPRKLKQQRREISLEDGELTKRGISYFTTQASTSETQVPWSYSDPNTKTSYSCHSD